MTPFTVPRGTGLESHRRMNRVLPFRLVTPGLLAATIMLAGFGLLGAHEHEDRNHEKVADAYDHIVVGKTRAVDLVGIGLDTSSGSQVPPALLRLKGSAAQACIAAGPHCEAYVYHTSGGDLAILVMGGRVIDKAFVAQA